MHRAHLVPALAAILIAGSAAAAPPPPAISPDAALQARVDKVLARTPLIDGHNDLPWEIRERWGRVDRIDLTRDTRRQVGPVKADGVPLMTDIARLRAGHVGGQFWSVWVPSDTAGPKAVEMTLEQIDLVKAMCGRWSADLEMAYTAEAVERIHRSGKIACLIGVEGGHQIDASLGVLRQMYAAGARYMTLTHFRNTPWADSATDAPNRNGLSPFGRAVVHEMNRMGMLVDLSHVSAATMRDALKVSQAPIIFSHSGAMALDATPRNVPDDVLQAVAKNGGLVMVNFYTAYVSETARQYGAAESGEEKRLQTLNPGDPKAVDAGLKAWRDAHPAPHATLAQVADHIDYVRKLAGVDHVGLGSDFDGIPAAPDGLDGVDRYPALLVELARRGWRNEDLGKLAGGNVLRVMREAEAVAKRLQASEGPNLASEAELDGEPRRGAD